MGRAASWATPVPETPGAPHRPCADLRRRGGQSPRWLSRRRTTATIITRSSSASPARPGVRRTTRLNLIMRSHFNDYYYISGDFKNGFLFAVGGEHKQNELYEINNENMNGLLGLAQPGSRRAPLELRAQAPRARVSPAEGSPWGRGSQRSARPACSRPRPPPSPPCPLLLKPEASPSALIGERSERSNGVPTPRPGAGLQCVPGGGVECRLEGRLPRRPWAPVAISLPGHGGSAWQAAGFGRAGTFVGALGELPRAGRGRRGRILNQRETE